MWFTVKILCFLCAALATQTWADGKISDDKAPVGKGIFSGLGILGGKDKTKEPVQEGCGGGDCPGQGHVREECGDQSVARSFRKYDIVPDLIPEPPQSYLEVWV